MLLFITPTERVEISAQSGTDEFQVNNSCMMVIFEPTILFVAGSAAGRGSVKHAHLCVPQGQQAGASSLSTVNYVVSAIVPHNWLVKLSSSVIKHELST